MFNDNGTVVSSVPLLCQMPMRAIRRLARSSLTCGTLGRDAGTKWAKSWVLRSPPRCSRRSRVGDALEKFFVDIGQDREIRLPRQGLVKDSDANYCKDIQDRCTRTPPKVGLLLAAKTIAMDFSDFIVHDQTSLPTLHAPCPLSLQPSLGSGQRILRQTLMQLTLYLTFLRFVGQEFMCCCQ